MASFFSPSGMGADVVVRQKWSSVPLDGGKEDLLTDAKSSIFNQPGFERIDVIGPVRGGWSDVEVLVLLRPPEMAQ